MVYLYYKKVENNIYKKHIKFFNNTDGGSGNEQATAQTKSSAT